MPLFVDNIIAFVIGFSLVNVLKRIKEKVAHNKSPQQNFRMKQFLIKFYLPLSWTPDYHISYS